MFGPPGKLPPPPPNRTVWANKTKVILDDVRKRRQELITKLDAEEQAAKELCNHTMPDGTSTIESYYDHEYDSHYTRCIVCQSS